MGKRMEWATKKACRMGPETERGTARMALWLMKTEPHDYSYEDLERDGKTAWDGVRNPTAQKHMRGMRRGDKVFIYHTGQVRAVVGVAEVITDPYPDPSDNRYVLVGLSPIGRLPRPVTLAEIKALPEFAQWELVRISRLSVMPVSPAHWDQILAMGGNIRHG